MAIKTITELKAYFETGDVPTQSDYIDVFDSLVCRGETSAQSMEGELVLPTLKVQSSSPKLYFNDSNNGANHKLWRIICDNSALSLQTLNDAEAVLTTPLSIDRDGNVSISSLKLNNAGGAAIVGSARVAAGSVAVYTSAITTKSVVLPSYLGTPTGILYVADIVSGVSFALKSTTADTISVRWAIVGEVA